MASTKYEYPPPPSVEGRLGDKYAVIEVGGLQQIVEEGHWYTCNRLKVCCKSFQTFIATIKAVTLSLPGK